MEPVIIAIIGAPGVGKSFLVEKLSEKLNAERIIEEVNEIPERIIENFKEDIRQMETIIWFRNKCIDDIEKAIELKNQGKIVIMDTCLISNELHITTMTSGFEQEVLLNQAKKDRKFMPQPDVILFLNASEIKIKELTYKRGRDFDTNDKFIQRNLSIRESHEKYFEENKDSLILIDRDNLNFEKEEDLEKVIEKINQFTG